MSRAPIEVSGYRGVTVVTYVIMVTVESCQEFVFRLAYVLYATTGTGYQVDALSIFNIVSLIQNYVFGLTGQQVTILTTVTPLPGNTLVARHPIALDNLDDITDM